MSTYTKQTNIMQYTEIVFYKDGVEIGRDEQNDHHKYDDCFMEPMTEQEIEDWQ